MITKPRLWLLAFVALIIGLAAYSRVLGTFFVADDFAYLDAIKNAGSPLVVFSALAGRYFRPTVVLLYYVNYVVSGLSPWSYHLSVVLVHVINTCLVFLLGRRLAPERAPFLPILAALLFLLFGGHAEAVSWIGGTADPLVTLFLLLAMLSFMRALESPRPVPFLIGVWVAFAGALFSKESSAIFPGLAVLILFLRPGWPDRERIRRTVIALVPVLAMMVGYVLLRKAVLGFAFVTLEGLGTSRYLPMTVRSFFVRSFLPQGPLLIRIWQYRLDMVLWVIVIGGFIWGLLRPAHRAIAFLTLCLALAIAPVLPLSIAIVTTDSERLIYLPSAFACLLTVWLFDLVLRQRWLVASATLCACLWHGVELRRHNRHWQAAAVMTQGIMTSYGSVIREHSRPGQPIFLMGLPDNVQSAFVGRRGFHEGLRVTSPDLVDAVARTYVMSIVQLSEENGTVDVTRTGPRTFQLAMTRGSMVFGGSPSPSPFWTPRESGPSGFVVDFTAHASRGLVIYFSPQETRVAGTLPMSEVPFGYIDMPADPITCNGRDPDMAGWALDDDGLGRIVIGVERTDASGGVRELWEGHRGPRPDVTAIYPDFPDSQNPGWGFNLSCAKLKEQTGDGPIRIVVIAENRRGGRTRLGTRNVVFPN